MNEEQKQGSEQEQDLISENTPAALTEDPEDEEQLAGTQDEDSQAALQNSEYKLEGVQVEPEAGYWARCRTLCTVTREEIRRHIGVVERYPSPNSPTEREELEEIRAFQANAYDKNYFQNYYSGSKRLSLFLTDPAFIRPWPFGAVLNHREDPAGDIPGEPILLNGAELATLFENETPGLWHRHVFNVFLDTRTEPGNEESPRYRDFLSAPRQALYWHALDLAIDSALQTVWHYKWLATNLPQVARRRRPYEADEMPILFDFKVEFDDDGNIFRTTPKPSLPPIAPGQPSPPSPGTPRHPAYGSGHSTYSAAASYVLGCLIGKFIDEWREEFARLADDIGEARIWGGVHWRTDHVFGQRIGRLVGQRVIQQLNMSGVLPDARVRQMPPSREVLEEEATRFKDRCGKNSNNFCAEGFNPQSKQGVQG